MLTHDGLPASQPDQKAIGRIISERLEFMTGFESTYMPEHKLDVLETSGHLHFFREDLKLVHDSGVRTVRYPVPWHRIEPEPGRYDWQWMDVAMNALGEFGLDPIVDPMHLTSYPAWLRRGFDDPEFPRTYSTFVRAFARRYPWVKKYTPFNEPFTTAFFCAHEGIWTPYAKKPETFVAMAVNLSKAICEVTATLDEELPGAQIVHVDTCEAHSALDPESVGFAAQLNERRFLVLDLILGRIDDRHPLYPYLKRHGLRDEDLAWFAQHPARIDILGLDYYQFSEQQFHQSGPVLPGGEPVGFAAVAMQYIQRYNLPIMLSETNTRGHAEDRISWLKYMVEQCERLVQSGVDFRGFCWFPFIDSLDWDSLLCRADRHIDPVGIYWLDEAGERHPSELSYWYGALARGEATSASLPCYRFREPLASQLAAFLPQMQHWEWREP